MPLTIPGFMEQDKKKTQRDTEMKEQMFKMQYSIESLQQELKSWENVAEKMKAYIETNADRQETHSGKAGATRCALIVTNVSNRLVPQAFKNYRSTTYCEYHQSVAEEFIFF